MTEADAGRAALAWMDAVLAKRPDKDDHALGEATRRLAEYRDLLIAGGPAADAGGRLGRLNAVISLAMALRFPTGKPPWDDFAAARGWLAELVAGAAAR